MTLTDDRRLPLPEPPAIPGFSFRTFRGPTDFPGMVRANMAGHFRVGPATLQSLYAPEFGAYSAGALLRVGAAMTYVASLTHRADGQWPVAHGG